jgi:molybdopterin converting factor small subunit
MRLPCKGRSLPDIFSHLLISWHNIPVKARHRREALLHSGGGCIRFGLGGQFVGGLLLIIMVMDAGPWAILMADLVLILGTALVVIGCAILASSRGRSPWWGLLGLLSILGVMFVMFLERPRRKRNEGGFEVRYLAPYRRDVWRMDLRVKLDASLGAGEFEPIVLQIARGATVSAAVKMLAGVVPALRLQSAALQFQLNQHSAKPTDELHDGDELVICRS